MRILLFISMLFLFSCENPPVTIVSLVPSYFDALDFSGIETLEAQPIINQGNVVQRENYLFINDRKRGIHVVDNSQPGNPFYMFFWKIPGNQEFVINGDYLYADNGPHLLVINISDFENIRYESFTPNVYFRNMSEQYPEDALPGTFFECPDPEKGLVKEWKQMAIQNPNCQKI